MMVLSQKSYGCQPQEEHPIPRVNRRLGAEVDCLVAVGMTDADSASGSIVFWRVTPPSCIPARFLRTMDFEQVYLEAVLKFDDACLTQPRNGLTLKLGDLANIMGVDRVLNFVLHTVDGRLLAQRDYAQVEHTALERLAEEYRIIIDDLWGGGNTRSVEED